MFFYCFCVAINGSWCCSTGISVIPPTHIQLFSYHLSPSPLPPLYYHPLTYHHHPDIHQYHSKNDSSNKHLAPTLYAAQPIYASNAMPLAKTPASSPLPYTTFKESSPCALPACMFIKNVSLLMMMIRNMHPL